MSDPAADYMLITALRLIDVRWVLLVIVYSKGFKNFILQTCDWDARKAALLNNDQSTVIVELVKHTKNYQQQKLWKDQQVVEFSSFFQTCVLTTFLSSTVQLI